VYVCKRNVFFLFNCNKWVTRTVLLRVVFCSRCLLPVAYFVGYVYVKEVAVSRQVCTLTVQANSEATTWLATSYGCRFVWYSAWVKMVVRFGLIVFFRVRVRHVVWGRYMCIGKRRVVVACLQGKHAGVGDYAVWTCPIPDIGLTYLFRTVYSPDGRVKYQKSAIPSDGFQIMVRVRVSRVRVSRISVWG